MELLSKKGYSKRHNIAESTAKHRIEKGELPSFKSGNRVYIPECIDLSLELKEAKEAIQPKCITLSTGNHKGGVLKTTNTQNIAASLAFSGYNVLIVDCDPQSNSTKGYGIFQEGRNLVENNVIQLLLDMKSDLTDEEYESKVRASIVNIERKNIHTKLDILPNDPKMIGELKKLDEITNAENTLDYILTFVKDDYDFIIIDTPPRTDTILKVCLMASDYFLISLVPEPYASLGIPDIFQPIKEIRRAYKMRKNKDIFLLGGIIGDVTNANLHKTNIEQNRKDIEHLSNGTASIFKTFIGHTVKVGESQYSDGAVMFTDFKHKATREYLMLTNEIVEKCLEIEAIRLNATE